MLKKIEERHYIISIPIFQSSVSRCSGGGWRIFVWLPLFGFGVSSRYPSWKRKFGLVSDFWFGLIPRVFSRGWGSHTYLLNWEKAFIELDAEESGDV